MGNYHAGETAVQERAGVRDMANRVANGIHEEIPPAAAEFMRNQPFAIVGSTDENGAVWASVLHGAPGFLKVVGTRTAQITAMPNEDDPLNGVLARAAQGQETQVGLLVIELATRRRMRLNGHVAILPDGVLQIQTDQVYANCPKYIQKRAWVPSAAEGHDVAQVSRGQALTPEQERVIHQADTFFVASASPKGDADASHRGGSPGFVQVVDSTHLLWPDYAGNTMFNTLGNIAVNPHAGLLFLDFKTGDSLQLTGRAQIVWDEPRIEQFSGAERLVSFEIDHVIEMFGAIPGHFRFVEASPFNP